MTTRGAWAENEARCAVAATTAAIPVMPLRFGWNGAAGLPGISGSTQRTELLMQASWPMLAV